MTDELISTDGISRREMLKRSAVVGGASAMVWAAPSLTTFAPRAFGANGTPASDYSNFGAVVTCGDNTYRIKADYNGETKTYEWKDAGTLGGCESAFDDDFFTAWCASTPALGGDLTGDGTKEVEFVRVGDDYYLVAPAGCTFLEGAAAALKQGVCCYLGFVTTYNGASAIKWDGPFSNQEPCLDGAGAAGAKASTPPKTC